MLNMTLKDIQKKKKKHLNCALAQHFLNANILSRGKNWAFMGVDYVC